MLTDNNKIYEDNSIEKKYESQQKTIMPIYSKFKWIDESPRQKCQKY